MRGSVRLRCPTCNIASFDIDGPGNGNGPATGRSRAGVVGVSKPQVSTKMRFNDPLMEFGGAENEDHDIREYKALQDKKQQMRTSIRETRV